MATSIIKLHALSGAGEGGSACFVLQIDDFHCLLDCGWSDKIEREYVKRLASWAKHLDAVLLSHQELRHLGLLPYLVGTCGLKCPIYATTPVYKMGQLTLYDFYQSMYVSSEFNAFSLDDVDATFDLVTQVRYQQTVNLPGRGRGICILPLPSGHTLGGTIWKLIKEDVDIVYAVDFNHKKERHLNGATFDACMRPHLLILDASNTLYSHPRRKDRDETLRQCILKSLRRGGNVLIAVDTSGRCLEIAHFLEQCWLNQDSGMMAYGLAMLSFVAFNVIDFAKSMVEWMSEKVMRTFEDQRSNPFHFRHLQLCHTLDQLDSVPEPKVVLATSSDLCCGFARQLFAEWADNDLNTVILTSRDSCLVTEGNTDQPPLIHRLIGLAKGDPAARSGLPTSSTGTLVLPLTLSQRVSESQLERLQSEMPRIRNAVQNSSIATGAELTKELDLTIPMPGVESTIEASPNERPFVSPDTSEYGCNDWRSIPADSSSKSAESNINSTATGNRTAVIFDSMGNQVPPVNSGFPISPFKLATTSTSHTDQEPLQLSVGIRHSMESGRLDTIPASTARVADLSQLSNAPVTQITVGRHQPGYDIYPGLHNHAGGQFFRMTKRTQLLFPQVEKKVHWDEYGGHLDPDLFAEADKLGLVEFSESKHKGQKAIQSVQPDLASMGLLPPSVLECFASKAYQLDDPSVKTHVITHQLEIPLRCELLFLDYEGRSDGEAMKRIVIGLRPQEMILVGNNQSAVQRLASYCRSVMLLGPDLVHTPNNGDVVNCTKEGDIFQARMKDSLVSSLRFTKIRDYELAWVEATLSLEDTQTTKPTATSLDTFGQSDVEMSEDLDDEVSGGKIRAPVVTDQLPVLNLPLGPIGPHKTVFVNEPKLSDLKQLLLAQGLVAEFVSGVLVVDNCVAIKRSEAGKLLLEGLLSRTYFDVRQILYQQFAIL